MPSNGESSDNMEIQRSVEALKRLYHLAGKVKQQAIKGLNSERNEHACVLEPKIPNDLDSG